MNTLAFVLVLCVITAFSGNTYVSSLFSEIQVMNEGNGLFSVSYAIDDHEDVRRSRSPILIGPAEKIIYSYAKSITGLRITIFKHTTAEDTGIVIATRKLEGENPCFWVSGKYESPQLLNCTKTIVCGKDQNCVEVSDDFYQPDLSLLQVNSTL